MEPIFKIIHFTDLLRIWKFVTTFYEYLELPEKTSQLSLYELNQHIGNHDQTLFIKMLIKSFLKKGHNIESNKKNLSVFHLAKYNRDKQILQELAELSAYQLLISQVISIAQWKLICQTIDFKKPYSQLSVESRYKFFSLLTDFVQMSAQFKAYLKILRQQYNQAIKVPGVANLSQLQSKFLNKVNLNHILGKDSFCNNYFWIANISNTVLVYNSLNKQWRQIIGKQELRQQVVRLLKNQQNLKYYQVDLLQSLNDIWSKLGIKSIAHYAFEKQKKVFNIKEKFSICDEKKKINVIKQKLKTLEGQYSKFLSDCWNYRWGTKQRRIRFIKQVNEAKQIKQLFSCFQQFYKQTKHTSYRKIKNYQFYDYSLSNQKDAKPQQFKNVFLRMNYLYVTGVIAQHNHQNLQKKDYSVNLYGLIKELIQTVDQKQQDNYTNFVFQYMMIFMSNMINIIKDIYPSKYRNRLLDMEKQQKRAQQRERQLDEQAKKQKNGKLKLKLKKFNGRNQISIDFDSSEGNESGDDSEDGSQEESGQGSSSVNDSRRAKLNQNAFIKGGKRLRQRAQINYKIQNSNSRQKQQKMSSQGNGQRKSYRLQKMKGLRSKGAISKQKSTKDKKSKKSKMRWDSEEQQSSIQLSIDEQDEPSTEQKSKNCLNLDSYQYIEDENQSKNFKRNLRSTRSGDKRK